MLSDPGMIKLIRENFVAATDNDWFNRRRSDAIGEFFIKVADQGPRSGPGTRQGHYIFTPSGKLLGYNNNRTIDRRLRFISEAIAKWEALPPEERMPGAVSVPPLEELDLDPKYHATRPEGGVALVISERILKFDAEHGLATCSAGDHEHEWGHWAAIDRIWIQKSEWEQLLAASLQQGGGSLPDSIARRLVRYHLVDFTRGEPHAWRNEDIKSLTTRVESPSANQIVISGKVEVSNGERGFDANFRGEIELTSDRRPARFDIVALGEHRGDSRYTQGSRPGKSPLGLAFRLADPTKPEDQIRPQGSHTLREYYTAERN